MIQQNELHKILAYDAATGVFTWRVTRGRTAKKGCIAGSLDKKIGYFRVMVNGKKYLLHRLAWFYVTGRWPTDLIDHKDGNPLNNVFSNLREANKSLNGANRSQQKNNTSGLRGVTFNKRCGMWGAGIKVNGRRRHIGYFICPAAAHLAYQLEADKAFGDYYRIV